MSAVEELLSKLLHPARLLCVKGDKRQAEALQRQIQQKYECTLDWVGSEEEAKHRLGQNKYDLLLLEATPQVVAAASLVKAAKGMKVPVVLVSEQPCLEATQEVAKHGVVCGLIGQVKLTDIDDLFDVFKIHVRSLEDTRYFESRHFSLRAPLAAV